MTEHFQLSEFVSKDGAETPQDVLDNLVELAVNLEVVRMFFDVPIKINSGYRSPAHNKKVGGSPNSQHLYGKAADIVVKGIPPKQVAMVLEGLIRLGFIEEGGIGVYSTFVHYDVRRTKARW